MSPKQAKTVKAWQKPDISIHKIFRSSANATPKKIALIDGKISLSYLEVDKLTDKLAAHLQEKGVGRNQIVGIHLEKCYEYIISCLAILKAGGAYMHLDLNYTPRTKERIIRETSPIVIISKNEHCSRLPENDISRVLVDDNKDWMHHEKPPIEDLSRSDDIAFIGHTSGTTGVPKGVKVSHRAAIYAISKFWQEIKHVPDSKRFGYATYICWDAMGPLMFNATGYIIPDDIDRDSLTLVKYIEQHGINHIFFTPSLLKSIFHDVETGVIRRALSNLNVIWLGGEVTTPEFLREVYEILPDVNLFNNYGPSECFVVAQGPLTKDDASKNLLACPVGKILPEMDALVLNSERQEMAQGETGELYVGGPCLAKGYIKNRKLTDERFINISGKTYLKTEDLAYLTPDRRLVIEGRIDSVVPINTNYASLTQIQSLLKKRLPMDHCVIIPSGKIINESDLVCFFVKNHESSFKIKPKHIRRLLDPILPKPLIPKKYVEVEKIPVNGISKKINYRQLYKLARTLT